MVEHFLVSCAVVVVPMIMIIEKKTALFADDVINRGLNITVLGIRF